MENKSYLKPITVTSLLPQILMLIMWLAQIFLTVDKEFMLTSAWPTPYKDAFNEDFTLYYIFYSAAILLICILSIINSRLTVASLPFILAFEIYTFISPILYKSIYYSTSQALRYTSAAFNVTEKFFYTHTLKSIIVIAVVVMLFFAILSRNKKIVVILFTISLLITVVYLIFEIINVSDTSALSDYQSQLIPKSAVIGVLRMTTLIPLFFVGFPTKE
jgi:hypothetical protein